MTHSKRKDSADAIKFVVTKMMDRVLERVLIKDPFVPETHHAKKPLYAALVPDEIFKGSHFERRFVTPFGRAWEDLTKVAALQWHQNASLSHAVKGNISEGRLRRIQEILNRLEHPSQASSRAAPNWSTELSYILEGKGSPIPVDVVCDVFIESKRENKRYAFELKGPLPNSDQTKVSKEKLFKLYAMEPCPVDQAYFALPYNPYGSKAEYAWNFPARWFDMKSDSCVLIGDEFWNFVGGPNTYEELVRTINTLGEAYKARIYKEYLNIEPTSNGSSLV